MAAPKLTDAERATDRRGLVAARAALHGDMPVFGLDLPQAPARRTTRVVLDVDWDPAVEDDPTTWSWDLGVDANPGHIRVVHGDQFPTVIIDASTMAQAVTR